MRLRQILTPVCTRLWQVIFLRDRGARGLRGATKPPDVNAINHLPRWGISLRSRNHVCIGSPIPSSVKHEGLRQKRFFFCVLWQLLLLHCCISGQAWCLTSRDKSNRECWESCKPQTRDQNRGQVEDTFARLKWHRCTLRYQREPCLEPIISILL